MPSRSAENSATLPQKEVFRLAEMRAVHSAFLYLHNQELEFRRWQREIAEIPAPPFGEAARSQWLAERFTALGLEQVRVDELGNVFWLSATSVSSPGPGDERAPGYGFPHGHAFGNA